MAIHYFNTSIRNLAWRLRKFEEVLAKNLAKEMHAHEDEIIEMIQHQLYDKGINGAGVEIKSYMPYKPSTIRKKQKKGQPFDRVTLRDTGQWYNSLVLVDDIEGFFITSTVAKNKYINSGVLVIHIGISSPFLYPICFKLLAYIYVFANISL